MRMSAHDRDLMNAEADRLEQPASLDNPLHIYHGNDRQRQIDWLGDVAADIAFADWDGTPTEKITHVVETYGNAIPDWFDDHDFDLLVQLVIGQTIGTTQFDTT